MKKQLLLLLMMLLPMLASAFEIIEVDGIYYQIFDDMNTATITYARDGNSYSGDIVIPDNFNYENKIYEVVTIGTQAFLNCSSLKSVYIGNNVKRIEYNAFKNCRELKNIVLSSNLEFIGDDAFQGCSGLQSIEIPNSVTKINSGAFEGCSNLKEIILPYGLNEIGYRVFRNCSSLTAIAIPVGVIKIGRQAFNGCESLSEISIPNSVKEIEEYAFKGCDALSSVKLSNNLTYIGQNAFYYCTSLTTIKIPNSVKQIDSNAFERCDYLDTVFLGRGVETIGAKALYGYRLMDVYCAAKTVPSVTNSTFYESAIKNATLHVPEEYINDYKSADVWKNFKTIVPYSVNTFKLTYIVDNVVYNEYELEEGEEITPEAAPTKEGYTFSGWSEIPETMPAHDVTVTGTFTINKYKMTYTVDGEEYKTYEVEFGATITPEAEPTKDGYTFSGWSEIPETMPDHDVTVTGTFTINKYKLNYFVDGEEYKSYDVEYGATITPEPAPTKEGHTFSGWSEIPKTMPAHDVTVTGTFSINKFKLTYIVDGGEYKSYELDYGASITPEAAPTKEGYTFSGWSEIPETMPAHDVTIYGTFVLNITTNNILQCTDIHYLHGLKPLLSVNLQNEDEVMSCQFDLSLPTGVTVATKSDGTLDVKLTERADNHSISRKQLENGNYRFIISSLDNDFFTGNNGTLLKIALDVSATMEVGEYTVKVFNTELRISNGNDPKIVKSADTESKLIVTNYTFGDVNDDGCVDIADAVCIVNYIVGKPTLVFIEAAADVNNDGVVDISDSVHIINFIVGKIVTLDT